MAITCIGVYYLQNLTSFQLQCKFDLIPAKESTFKLETEKGLNLILESYTSAIWCPSNFKFITVQPNTVLTVFSGFDIHSVFTESDTN